VNHPERSPFSAGEWNWPLQLLIDDSSDALDIEIVRRTYRRQG
jgi:hypothetical protein